MLEIVGPEFRTHVYIAFEFGFSLTYVLMPWIQYYVRHFRVMQLIVTLYECLWLYWLWQIPESPRWQLTHNYYDEAEKTLLEAAKQKGDFNEEEVRKKLQVLRQNLEEDEQEREKESRKTIFDLWKVTTLLKYSLALYFVWFTTAFICYAFSYNAVDIGGSLFVNMFIFGCADTVANTFTFFAMPRFNRKTMGVTFLVLCSLASFAMIPFTFDESGLLYRKVLSFVGKFCISVIFYLIYLLSAEIFPTTLRQVSVGSCSAAARLGSILVPFLKELVSFFC